MIECDKIYDPALDVWRDSHGKDFVKNLFHTDEPLFVSVSDSRWVIHRLGVGYVDWDELKLPIAIELAFKTAIKQKLKSVSHVYLNACRNMLTELKRLLKEDCFSLSDLKMPEINTIWQKMTRYSRHYFRELYKYLANHHIDGANQSIATKLNGMKARTDVRHLKHVLNWHPTKGALTQEEESLLRNSIETKPKKESAKKLGLRIFCWLLIATLKRGKQIRELHLNCLSAISNNGNTEYFVRVKPVKNQTGDPFRWWPIPEALYLEMQDYCEIPSVKVLQQKYDRFWVMDCPTLHQDKVVSAADAKAALSYYITSLELISPRTQKRLHVTPTRIRHTGATRLAFKGVSRDIISEMLEHDNPNSCQTYIDAVGSELCPALNRADRNMGAIFSKFSQVYFEGKVVDELADQPIVIPDFTEHRPLFVGSCARDTCKEGRCNKHPFIGCYNGCSSFLAWREADHQRALDFAEKELERWRKAIGHAERVSIIMEYEELKNNILQVIEHIQEMKA